MRQKHDMYKFLRYLEQFLQPQEEEQEPEQEQEQPIDYDMLKQLLMQQEEPEEEQNQYGNQTLNNVDYSKQDIGDLMSKLRQRESGGNYGAINSLGYAGGYQFGPQALEQVGYLKPGASKLGMKALEDEGNWTIPGGKQAFLSNPQIQDTAMKKLMSSNQKQLSHMGLINKGTSQQEIDGLLAAAHLSGVGGVKKMLSGQGNPKDAYGTSARDYYNLGRGY
jgi:hypothetical protein